MIPLVAKLKVIFKLKYMNIGSIVWELYTNVLMLIKKPLNIIQVVKYKDASDVVAYRLSQCHSEMGTFPWPWIILIMRFGILQTLIM